MNRAALVLQNLILSLCLSLLCSCGTVRLPEKEIQSRIQSLRGDIVSLGGSIAPEEADRIAETSIRYSLQLAQEYHATPPALVNNVLINWGLHKRGLCYQWADDLTAKLLTLHLRTIELHRGVAALGTDREHSCVVLMPPGTRFEDGLVLDAWRHCGDLAWSVVKKDKFHWREVILNEDYNRELQDAANKLETTR